MKNFGEVFREERKKKGLKLKELKDQLGLSISYLSDIEHSRKSAPSIDIVKKIEVSFGIRDGRLAKIAERSRRKLPENFRQTLNRRPFLQEVLLKADQISDDDFEDLLNKIL